MPQTTGHIDLLQPGHPFVSQSHGFVEQGLEQTVDHETSRILNLYRLFLDYFACLDKRVGAIWIILQTGNHLHQLHDKRWGEEMVAFAPRL